MEFVYVVKRRDLFDRTIPHGLKILDDGARRDVEERVRRHGFFVERRHAETDPSMKQVIPYCVVVRREAVFVMRRLAGGGEVRLHGKRSVGVGGHVNPIDAGTGGSGGDVLRDALRREIDEELHVEGAWDVRTVGMLNDDTTDVGSVHVGLVGVVTTDADVRVREVDTLEGRFVPVAELRQLLTAERESFETWSALVLDRIDDWLP